MSEAIITEFETLISSKTVITDNEKKCDIAKKAFTLIKERVEGITSLLSNLLGLFFSEKEDDIFINTLFFEKSDDVTDDVKKSSFRILNNFYLREPAALRLLLRYYFDNYDVIASDSFEERLFARLESTDIFDFVLGKFAENPSAAPRAQKLYVRYLENVPLSPEKFGEISISAVKNALLSDKIFCVDSLLRAISKRADDVNATLLGALRAFSRGRYSEYVSAVNDVTNDVTLKFLGEQKIFGKMRMLTVASVCAAAGAGAVVAFGDLAKELDVAEGDVEGWVIKAIGAKLVVGRINQVDGNVAVGSVAQRVFEKEEWSALGKLLGAWKENITAINKLAEDQKQEFSQLIMKKKEVKEVK